MPLQLYFEDGIDFNISIFSQDREEDFLRPVKWLYSKNENLSWILGLNKSGTLNVFSPQMSNIWVRAMHENNGIETITLKNKYNTLY